MILENLNHTRVDNYAAVGVKMHSYVKTSRGDTTVSTRTSARTTLRCCPQIQDRFVNLIVPSPSIQVAHTKALNLRTNWIDSSIQLQRPSIAHLTRNFM